MVRRLPREDTRGDLGLDLHRHAMLLASLGPTPLVQKEKGLLEKGLLIQ